MGDKKDVPNKNIIYLNKEKKSICVDGNYIDLNLVTNISDYSNHLKICFLNGSDVSVERPTTDYSYLNVPTNYMDDYDRTEIEIILKKLSSEFDFHYISHYRYDFNRESKYRIYNKIDTEKREKFNSIQWKKLKNRIINKWLDVDDVNINVINPKVIRLMEDYYTLNKDNNDILDNIKKVFGYDYDEILKHIEINEDFYVTTEGNIVKV